MIGLHFFLQDPQGFFVIESKGLIVGSIAAVKHVNDGRAYVHIGLFIIDEHYRGQGFGHRLWDHVIGNLPKNCTLGLYAVPEQVGRYRSWSGLESVSIVNRYQMLTSVKTQSGRYAERGIVEVDAVSSALSNFVRPFFSSGLKYINIPDYITLALYDKSQLIMGYGAIRLCKNGNYRLGPLLAHSSAAAVQLAKALVRRIKPGKTIFLDVSEVKDEASNVLAMQVGFSLQAAGICIEMQANGRLKFDSSHVIAAISTLEIR